MAEVKWIKICTDIFDDEKIALIESMPEADGIIVIWFKLLCMAGKQNNGGVFMLNDKLAYTDEMLATIFRRPLNTVRLALSTFEQFGMITVENKAYTIPNWDKHQSLDKLEKAREQTRKRVAKYREKQKQIAGGNVTVTKSNADRVEEDEDKEKEKDIDKEVDVVEGGTDGSNTLNYFNKNLLLSDNQVAELLELMGLEVFDEYTNRLSKFIDDTGANIKSHYATLLKWYKEDCAVGG